MESNIKNFYIISIGFILIVLGGITNILEGMVFWYLLGLITVPFVTAWIDWSRVKMEQQKPKPTQ